MENPHDLTEIRSREKRLSTSRAGVLYLNLSVYVVLYMRHPFLPGDVGFLNMAGWWTALDLQNQILLNLSMER